MPRQRGWDGATGTYPQWYEDPLSCLQTTVGSILLEHGLRPVEVLGLACEFAFAPQDTMCEEFYRPAQSSRGVAADLCPYHDVESEWTSGKNADDLIELIEKHASVIVAVDNYHLPFRPAYHDVHAAHLVVVPAWRKAGGETEFYVSDAQPPRFQGWLPAEHLMNAWTSGNPADHQDVFFSSSEIAGRVLTARVGSEPEELTADGFGRAIEGNLERWNTGAADDADRVWTGQAGVRRFVQQLQERSGDPAELRPAYTFGWAMQAQAFLHGRLTQEFARRANLPYLSGIAAAADSVMSAWSNLRLLSAHAANLARVPELVLRRGDELVHAYEQLAVEWRLAASRGWAEAR
ncbi:BtrH N-terminal domain-containing protein [Amycolatopsis sp. cg13]|uniref:BtrH N-terminal domain-containing protein n=1 Tax=Amycolatopsis sp. cg13 TaxID=3238807 RepID=UPI003524C425